MPQFLKQIESAHNQSTSVVNVFFYLGRVVYHCDEVRNNRYILYEVLLKVWAGNVEAKNPNLEKLPVVN